MARFKSKGSYRRLFIFTMSVLLCGIVLISFVVYFSRYASNYRLSLSGQLYACNKGAETLTVYDLKTGDQIDRIQLINESHEIIEIGDSLIAVANYGDEYDVGHYITFIDIKKNKPAKIIDITPYFRPHGLWVVRNSLFVCGETDSKVVKIDLNSLKIVQTYQTDKPFNHIVNGYKEDFIIVSSIGSNTVTIIDQTSGVIKGVIPTGADIMDVGIRNKGAEIWVANHGEDKIVVYDSKTLSIIEEYEEVKTPTRFVFNREQDMCFVANGEAGTVTLIDAAHQRVTKIIRFPGNGNLFDKALYHTPRIVQLKLHENEKYLFVSNSNADKIEVVDLDKLRHCASLKTEDIPDGLAILHK